MLTAKRERERKTESETEKETGRERERKREKKWKRERKRKREKKREKESVRIKLRNALATRALRLGIKRNSYVTLEVFKRLATDFDALMGDSGRT